MSTHFFPNHIRSNIQALKHREKKILMMEESTWRLTSRALWLKEGDQNTKFFHRYANFRRNINSIWQITDLDGHISQTQEEISDVVVNFFQNTYGTMKILLWKI